MFLPVYIGTNLMVLNAVIQKVFLKNKLVNISGIIIQLLRKETVAIIIIIIFFFSKVHNTQDVLHGKLS